MSSRFIVGVFAGLRVAIGVGFAIAPDRLGEPSGGPRRATLMTRSFAVREAVLGVGGLLAVAGTDESLSAVRTWAGLGALTDIGDLGASLVSSTRARDRSGYVPALVAAAGLLFELWAFTAAVQPRESPMSDKEVSLRTG